MGKLIDETNLMNLLYALDDARHDLCYAIKKIPELPAVEAIPKADYENRLKADMVAMFTELQLEIEELPPTNRAITDSSGLICYGHSEYEATAKDASKIIQQKINSLKAESEDNNETM